MAELATPTRVMSPLTYPAGGIDAMLAASAHSWPERVAVYGPAGPVTFAEMDVQATTCAAAIRDVLGDRRDVVAVSARLDPIFPATYYGIARSGNPIATLNPLLPAEGLAHALRTSRARLAIVGAAEYDALAPLRSTLDDLEFMFVFGSGQGPRHSDPAAPAGPVPSADAPQWMDRLAAVADAAVPPVDIDEDGTAVIAYTSGTTGVPKGVLLSHRNIKVNASQVGRAHRLDSTSTILTYLPVYAPMHMNAAVRAGASQVLCPSRDILDAIAAADRNGVTHFYTLPLVLGWFVSHPRFTELSFDTVRMIASGSSPLAPRLVDLLTTQFRVPVFQGYGMCEASYLAFSDEPDSPRPGSVGRPLAEASVRVVDLDERTVLDAGGVGEVQLGGPQMMKGYLDPSVPSPFDAEGWYSTGDVGYLDSDGYLFVLDRAKDVFRTDGGLVSPSQVERVLAEHPAVQDCVVVQTDTDGDVVPAALVVPKPQPDADLLTEIREFANARLAPHEQVRHVAVASQIPRSPTNGKVLRAQARDEVRAALAGY